MTDRPTSASIVVPICDALAYLERSLPALAAVVRTQGHEWIVVDDGSHDGGPDLARSLGARVLSSGGRRLGPAQARNVGVAEASGGRRRSSWQSSSSSCSSASGEHSTHW